MRSQIQLRLELQEQPMLQHRHGIDATCRPCLHAEWYILHLFTCPIQALRLWRLGWRASGQLHAHSEMKVLHWILARAAGLEDHGMTNRNVERSKVNRDSRELRSGRCTSSSPAWLKVGTFMQVCMNLFMSVLEIRFSSIQKPSVIYRGSPLQCEAVALAVAIAHAAQTQRI